MQKWIKKELVKLQSHLYPKHICQVFHSRYTRLNCYLLTMYILPLLIKLILCSSYLILQQNQLQTSPIHHQAMCGYVRMVYTYSRFMFVMGDSTVLMVVMRLWHCVVNIALFWCTSLYRLVHQNNARPFVFCQNSMGEGAKKS